MKGIGLLLACCALSFSSPISQVTNTASKNEVSIIEKGAGPKKWQVVSNDPASFKDDPQDKQDEQGADQQPTILPFVIAMAAAGGAALVISVVVTVSYYVKRDDKK